MSELKHQGPIDLTKSDDKGFYLEGYKTLELTVDSVFVTPEVEIEEIHLNGVVYVKKDKERT